MPHPLPPTAEDLRQAIAAALHPQLLQVIDESAQHAGHAGANGLGYGSHFRVRIAAPAFAGATRVQAHRMVYAAVQPYMQAGLHALAIEVVSAPDK